MNGKKKGDAVAGDLKASTKINGATVEAGLAGGKVRRELPSQTDVGVGVGARPLRIDVSYSSLVHPCVVHKPDASIVVCSWRPP